MSIITMVWSYCQANIRTRIRNERGASLVEYALLLALIAVICIAAISFIGQKADESFSSTGSALD